MSASQKAAKAWPTLPARPRPLSQELLILPPCGWGVIPLPLHMRLGVPRSVTSDGQLGHGHEQGQTATLPVRALFFFLSCLHELHRQRVWEESVTLKSHDSQQILTRALESTEPPCTERWLYNCGFFGPLSSFRNSLAVLGLEFSADGQVQYAKGKKKKKITLHQKKNQKYTENPKCFLLGNLTLDRNAGWRQGVRRDMRWDVAARMHFPDQISMLGILL